MSEDEGKKIELSKRAYSFIRDLRVPLTHTKELLLVTFCDPTAGIVKWDRTDGLK